MISIQEAISAEYSQFLQADSFPCVAAKAAAQRKQVRIFVAKDIASGGCDKQITDFIYSFITEYRASKADFHSAAVIFLRPASITEELFETFMWQRLQALSDEDAKIHEFDSRVNSDPSSPDFSFSLGSEAFFIIGMFPFHSRAARRFRYPTIVFNPHEAFTRLRENNQFDKLKTIVRNRDIHLAGSVNPMLEDFGSSSEVFQYSGKKYQSSWQCPLQIKHGTTNHTSS